MLSECGSGGTVVGLVAAIAAANAVAAGGGEGGCLVSRADEDRDEIVVGDLNAWRDEEAASVGASQS